MDLDGLFWIALLVFYFVARTIGGGKRSNQTGKRQPQEARGDTSRGGTDELSGALDEIRRALGYPDAEEVEEVETSTAKGTQQWTKEQHAEKRTAKAPTDPRTKSHTKSRTRSTSIKKRSRPEVGDKIVPGLPALTSSFSEEEAFERVGRHPHRTTRHDLRVVSPYEKPARKQLPGLRRRLTNRASLREAFLVKEILDRPVSMRRR